MSSSSSDHVLNLIDERSILGDNDIDDVQWLCSLSNSEIDLLIALKSVVKNCAEATGQHDLADKFNLRMVRDFGLVFKGMLERELNDHTPGGLCIDKLLNQKPRDSFAAMTVEELYPYICSNGYKRRKSDIDDRLFGDMPSPPRPRKPKPEIDDSEVPSQ